MISPSFISSTTSSEIPSFGQRYLSGISLIQEFKTHQVLTALKKAWSISSNLLQVVFFRVTMLRAYNTSHGYG